MPDDWKMPPRDVFHINVLRYFREVARTGSIREAGALLNVAPSAISRQIGKLEAEIGEILFNRTRQGMGLTPAGLAYSAYVNNVIAAQRQLRSEVDDLRGLKTGTVRVVSIEGLIAPLVSRAISDFRAEYPDVTFTVEIVSATDVVRKLASGAADIGLAFNAPAETAIRYLKRLSDPVVAVISPQARILRRRKLSMVEVLSERIAIPVVGFGIRDLIDQACRLEKLPLNPALETNSIEAMRSFARNGDGISLLHRMAVAREVMEETLTTLDIASPPLRTGTIDICTSGHVLLPVAAQKFAVHLCGRLAA